MARGSSFVHLQHCLIYLDCIKVVDKSSSSGLRLLQESWKQGEQRNSGLISFAVRHSVQLLYPVTGRYYLNLEM